MRISLSTGTFYHRGLRYSLRLAQEAGYDGVEWVVGPEYIYFGMRPIERAVAAGQTPILSLHPPFYPLPGWPRGYREALTRLATLSLRLGAALCVSHTPSLHSFDSPRARAYTRGLRLGREAGQGAVTLALESNQYNQRPQRYALDDLRALTAFALERDCGVTFDTTHAGANGEDLIASYEIVRPALRNVHLSDALWRDGEVHTHILPGEGVLPLTDLLARLAQDGYDGLVTLELHPNQVGLFPPREHAVARLRKALDYVRAATAQVVR